ncbi:MAG: aminoacyl-histidine dipeptidase [Bacteroidales bacterium]|nr:aminoacyl-histidine dipeptidase [Bacteroidales bacterium]
MTIKDLQPQEIWKYFDEITKIPRPSKKEEKIIQYLLDFAKEHNLEAEKDEVGNVIIRKPATPGKENSKTVILQSHSDIVCEKNSDVVFDFDNDPIQTYIDGDWVKAKGTTLGGDDGIGIAASLVVLASTDLQHGPVEALFTADEETGMSGAFGLKEGFMKGEILINLDSEDEGELFIGCAGGMDTVAEFSYKKKPVPEDSGAYKIAITGLNGGHSGDEIDSGLGNSNKILNRIILSAYKKFKIRLADFNGGNLRNAIAREAFGIITIYEKHTADFESLVSKLSIDIKNEFSVTEKNLEISYEKIELPEFVISKKIQKRLMHSLYACWHGVYAMSADMPGLVETSTNLASVKFIDDNKIKVETSQRSSVESGKYDMAQTVASVFKLAGAKVKHGDGYPGWKPNTDSEIMKITEESYKRLFNKTPEVKAIHAGLECGLFLEKYPYLDMISFGPTIKGAHSPDERMNIPTVQKFWDLLVDVLEMV